MGKETEIEIDIAKLFGRATPAKIFLIAIILSAALIAAFYLTSSGAPEEPPEVQYPDVTLYILNDDDCMTCATGEMLSVLRQIIPGLKEVRIDINSQEGEALIAAAQITDVPAYIFDSSIENSPIFPNLQSYLSDRGNHYVVRALGAKLINREEAPNTLELFVMPTEENAMALEYTLAEFLNKYDAQVALFFIAFEVEDGLYSQRGVADIEEGIRQACAAEHEPDLFGYVLCRNDDINGSWEDCARNPGEMRNCSEGEEGIILYVENIRFTNELGVMTSPLLLFNQQVIMLGNKPYEMIEYVYCDLNPDQCD